MISIYDTIIIGAGPAGMSAGVYVCRQRLKTLILSKDIGGQTAKSWEVENYLGFSLISGPELATKFNQHLSDFKCVESKISFDVKKIEKQGRAFKVIDQNNQEYQTKTIIIASGKNPRELGVPGENEFKNKGVTYCATCDAPIFKNKTVAVIGGGNAALDAAFQLAKLAKQVYIFVRDSKFKERVDKVLLGNVINNPLVKIIFSAAIVEIIGEKFVSHLKYRDLKTNEEKVIPLEGIFVEIGSVPVTDFCQKLVKLNKQGEIIIDEHNMTSVPGIFAAGDVTAVVEKQTIIAAGEGAKAAIGVANYLSRLKP